MDLGRKRFPVLFALEPNLDAVRTVPARGEKGGLMKRRSFIFGGLGALVVAGSSGVFAVSRLFRNDQAIIKEIFGERIAVHDATLKFLNEYKRIHASSELTLTTKDIAKIILGRAVRSELKLIRSFVQSTNIIVFSNGLSQEFIFTGVFRPYDFACSNQLSAQWGAEDSI